MTSPVRFRESYFVLTVVFMLEEVSREVGAGGNYPPKQCVTLQHSWAINFIRQFFNASMRKTLQLSKCLLYQCLSSEHGLPDLTDHVLSIVLAYEHDSSSSPTHPSNSSQAVYKVYRAVRNVV